METQNNYKTGNEVIDKYLEEIKSNKILEDFFDIVCDMIIEDKETVEYDLKSLMEQGESNYELLPFAVDGTGSVYALLNNEKVGYIGSEGETGIIANNFKNFLSILIVCQMVCDYRNQNLKTESSFFEILKIQDNPYNDKDNQKNIERKREVENFIKKHNLETNPKNIYKLFKEAASTEPKFIIKALSDDYEDSSQLFDI
ncbi:hypothetical protein BCR32DRAFT_268299 [Anaeromyces robustus]|uniref:Uncharacterized protein n=1 Tax=Anaeromyces robustus TaxID=1754192 RepID=A0A1Y1X7P6_9FUNG|nr:hypothetical protein BCR32DRAFT_268299 [Anaeromyces robustus]|eukprot:ORX81354.1 hypothetical protein BCR32DRAFT_268299 [Anaeromyces robustus]